MFLSMFDIFKIGVGPSSSHTMGPMIAGKAFVDLITTKFHSSASISATLYGSLAHTGVGHATDRAVILGLSGVLPETYDHETSDRIVADVCARKVICAAGGVELIFDPRINLIFDFEHTLKQHSNAITFKAFNKLGTPLVKKTYFSIGGGFIVDADELKNNREEIAYSEIPFPFNSSEEMLRMARSSGKSIAEMQMANEKSFRSHLSIESGIKSFWSTMEEAIDRGLRARGILPGGLNVRRRAPDALQDVKMSELERDIRYLFVYAMATNEENAAGGKIVTAPTNGAAGVVPTVARFWTRHTDEGDLARLPEYFLTAAAIGGLLKKNASISGAEAGCQAEVGSASAMAAAALCAVSGGTPEQIECAAEIALEHHLGMTCDPIKGLVQVPCIERNGFGAVKAFTAANMALLGDGKQVVSLDTCIETMRQTGLDMNNKYKETSLGGLAACVPNC